MNSIQDVLSLATWLVILGLAVACAMKIFQMATDIREAKEVLKDIRKNTANAPRSSLPPAIPQLSTAQYSATEHSEPPAPEPHPSESFPSAQTEDPRSERDFRQLPGLSANPTAEELVRAIHATTFKDGEFPL